MVISYSPTGLGHEAVLSIRAAEAGVRLYFGNGKDLPDPAGLLQGKANQTRWISLERASDLAKPEIARLIDEAIIRNRIPFASSGRGPLVIRPTTASRR